MDYTTSLKNNLLIAMPSLADPYFNQAVIYVHEHDEKGAVGFIVNKPSRVMLGEVLQRINISATNAEVQSTPMMIGGPVAQEQVFMIQHHSYIKKPTEEEIHYTISKEVLEGLATGEEQSDVMVFFGYAAWEPGQLEKELMNNYWLMAPADTGLLFSEEYSDRYKQAIKLIGIDLDNLSDDVGHA